MRHNTKSCPVVEIEKGGLIINRWPSQSACARDLGVRPNEVSVALAKYYRLRGRMVRYAEDYDV